jgi:hypothetical protein
MGILLQASQSGVSIPSVAVFIVPPSVRTFTIGAAPAPIALRALREPPGPGGWWSSGPRQPGFRAGEKSERDAPSTGSTQKNRPPGTGHTGQAGGPKPTGGSQADQGCSPCSEGVVTTLTTPVVV